MKHSSLLTSESEQNRASDIESAPARPIADVIGLGILSLAVIALAFSPIFTKLSELEISPIATIFNRLWIATVVMSVWQLGKPKPQRNLSDSGLIESDKTLDPLEEYPSESLTNYQRRGLLILSSVSATASAVLWAVSFTQTSVASSTVLRSLTPLFIGLGAWLILNQTFNRQFILGMILSIVGGITIGWDDWQTGTEYLIGDAIALLSAALHSANILIIGFLRDRGSTTEQVLLWRCGGGAIVTFPIAYLTNTPLLPISLFGWFTVIALAVVCQTLGQGLLVFSLKQYSSSFVGIFALLKPIITALLAWLIFAEGISLYSGIALILIVTGIYLAKTSNSSVNKSTS
ncbi:MAG: DMT family transporter [Cyanobacteria bacterium J06621_8]